MPQNGAEGETTLNFFYNMEAKALNGLNSVLNSVFYDFIFICLFACKALCVTVKCFIDKVVNDLTYIPQKVLQKSLLPEKHLHFQTICIHGLFL